MLLRQLERLLMLMLVWMGVTTLWVGLSLDDPSSTNISSDGERLFWLGGRSHFNNQTGTGAHRMDYAASSIHSLWTSNPSIPGWMKEYMDWHSATVATLNPDNWEQHQYLVLRCYRKDERCGGVSDRLKPVPFMLLAAQRSHRLLFIDWDRPCPLSEFLVPPVGGFQWNAPSFLSSLFQNPPRSSMILSRAANLMEKCETSQTKFIQAHIHDTQGGMTQYDRELGAGAFQDIYHDLFRIFFRPSPGVQRLIDLHFQVLAPKTNTNNHDRDQLLSSSSNNRTSTSTTPAARTLLIEGEYSVAHYRAEYGREVARHPKLTEPAFLRRVAINALRCASELQQAPLQSPITSTTTDVIPIYFASDNILALETAREIAATLQYPIITFDRQEKAPLKLDDYYYYYPSSSPIVNNTNNNSITTTTNAMANDNVTESTQGERTETQPSDYYSTFVDLIVAGSGKCVTYGRGGFGRFASLLSYNASCSFKHVKQFFPVPCVGRPPFSGPLE